MDLTRKVALIPSTVTFKIIIIINSKILSVRISFPLLKKKLAEADYMHGI